MKGSAAKAARLIVVMGVSGAGKTTVGEKLADILNVPFIDADDLHPRANIEKMRGGQPLEDTDRWPWLETVSDTMRNAATMEGRVVSACSALRRRYRDFMVEKANEPIVFILLHGDKALIASRQADRPGHFMPAALLESQFATLEQFHDDELGITLDVKASPDLLAAQAAAILR